MSLTNMRSRQPDESRKEIDGVPKDPFDAVIDPVPEGRARLAREQATTLPRVAGDEHDKRAAELWEEDWTPQNRTEWCAKRAAELRATAERAGAAGYARGVERAESAAQTIRDEGEIEAREGRAMSDNPTAQTYALLLAGSKIEAAATIVERIRALKAVPR